VSTGEDALQIIVGKLEATTAEMDMGWVHPWVELSWVE